MNGDYIIKGNIGEEEHLVYVCLTYDHAAKILDRMLNNPNDYDKKLMDKYSDIKIDFVEEKECWWRYIYD